MKSKEIIKKVPFTSIDMFNLVKDVKMYPEFVPACKSIGVIDSHKDNDCEYINAIMEVGYGILNEKFTSNIKLNKKQLKIDVVNRDGPFVMLNNTWNFVQKDNECEINFKIDFQSKQTFTGAIINLMFDKVFMKYVSAFERRAHYICN